jgi:hypothetical protein
MCVSRRIAKSVRMVITRSTTARRVGQMIFLGAKELL